MKNITIAVLAGGKSSRFGTDKASVSFLGRPLLFWVLERVKKMPGKRVIVGSSDLSAMELEFPIIEDLIPGMGPLGGLHAALDYASTPFVIVVGCDMPFISDTLLSLQLEIIQSENRDVVIPLSGNGLEPLHAVYRKETCLPLVEKALRDSKTQLVSWLTQANVRYLSIGSFSIKNITERVFFNINDPPSLKFAEDLASNEQIIS